MTDDLSMKALKGSFANRCSASFDAGCDVVLHCNGVMDEMTQVASACPALTGSALTRANAALDMRKTPDAFDLNAAKDQFAKLMDEAA
jgi:beta-N-acetylhexosaminidase